MLAMLFGQFALAAYAVRGAAAGRAASRWRTRCRDAGDAGQVPCAAMLSPADAPQANACEVHCTDGVTSLDASRIWPPVTLAALPVPTLALAQLADATGPPDAPSAPLPGAPPPTVRFCRLLI